jgi:hypothetical protein
MLRCRLNTALIIVSRVRTISLAVWALAWAVKKLLLSGLGVCAGFVRVASGGAATA